MLTNDGRLWIAGTLLGYLPPFAPGNLIFGLYQYPVTWTPLTTWTDLVPCPPYPVFEQLVTFQDIPPTINERGYGIITVTPAGFTVPSGRILTAYGYYWGDQARVKLYGGQNFQVPIYYPAEVGFVLKLEMWLAGIAGP